MNVSFRSQETGISAGNASQGWFVLESKKMERPIPQPKIQAILKKAPVQEIPTAQIRVSSFQPRVGEITTASVKSLAASIREDGQIETAIVRRTGDPKKPFELIAGERRWRSCKLLGWDLRASIVETDDPRVIARLALGSNEKRKKLTGLDILTSCIRMRNELEMSVSDIGGVFIRSVQWASNVLACERLHPKIKPLLAIPRTKGGISLSVGIELAGLTPAYQLKALKRIRAGRGGQKTARKVVGEMKQAGAPLHADAAERILREVTTVMLFTRRCTELTAELKPWTTAARKKALGVLDDTQRSRAQDAFRRVIEKVREVASACGMDRELASSAA